MEKEYTLNKDLLKKEFAAMGIHAGMNLMVHSSLSRLGYVEGGADAVLDALMELITEEGTLMLPSFNHDDCYHQGELFDVRKTRTTNGLIPDTFWRREGVLRSNSPTHAFAAWGKNAEKYLLNHENVITMGEGSPLDLLMQDGGYCLLLGVGYHSNTFHHCVEMLEKAPCLGRNSELYPMITRDGSEKMVYNWGWRSHGCPLNDWARYAPEMEKIHTQHTIGKGTATLYKLKDGYPIIAKNMHEGLTVTETDASGSEIGPVTYPPCSQCSIRPRKGKYTIIEAPESN